MHTHTCIHMHTGLGVAERVPLLARHLLLCILYYYIYIYIYIYNTLIYCSMYVCIYIYIYIYREREREREMYKVIYGQFSEFHVCFCGLDPGNLKFETVRTNKQHICF